MNLKENLLQLCDIRKEIKELENKIDKLELKSHEIVSDSVENTTKIFPIIQTKLKIKGLDQETRKKLEYYRTVLENRYDALLDVQIKTEEFINNLPTSRLRRIFTYRYIDQLTWIKIARLIGGNATEESIKKENTFGKISSQTQKEDTASITSSLNFQFYHYISYFHCSSAKPQLSCTSCTVRSSYLYLFFLYPFFAPTYFSMALRASGKPGRLSAW